MTAQGKTMRMRAVGLGVVVIAIVAAAGILVMRSQSSANNSANLSTSSTPSTICEVGVEGAGVFLHIISDSTRQPLSGISVSAVPVANSCFGASRPGPSSYTTNATGWVSLDVSNLQANYFFETSLVYAGRNYSFTLPQGPIETTNATLSLPSGTLSTSLCFATGSKTCFPYSAPTTTTTGTPTSVTTITTLAKNL